MEKETALISTSLTQKLKSIKQAILVQINITFITVASTLVYRVYKHISFGYSFSTITSSASTEPNTWQLLIKYFLQETMVGT